MTNIMDDTANTGPLTPETMMAAIDKLNDKPVLPEDHPMHGVFVAKECAALKGSEVVVISDGKAYYWPDVFDAEKVKVIKLPDSPRPELRFKWDFTTTENLKF